MAKKRTEGTGMPYNVWHREDKKKGRENSVGGKQSKEKVANICDVTAKRDQKAQNELRAAHAELVTKGLAGPRLGNGSYWGYGAPNFVK